MSARVIEVRHTGNYRVWLRFADGVEGEVDLERELWGEVFEPLRDRSRFAEVTVDGDLDTIVWPNGADISPDWLRQQLECAQSGKAVVE